MPPFRKASSLSQTLVKSKTLKLRALGWTGGAAFGKGTCYPGERVGGGDLSGSQCRGCRGLGRARPERATWLSRREPAPVRAGPLGLLAHVSLIYTACSGYILSGRFARRCVW